MKNRLYYFDAVRVWLTVLVFYHHTAIAFGASGNWYYESSLVMTGVTEALSWLSVTVNQSFFMSLFFFLSAYLMPQSLERKGVRSFVRSRLLRLGVPLVLYTFVGDVLLEYIIYGGSGGPGPGPMWFVAVLLVFELLFGLCLMPLFQRLAARKPKLKWSGMIAFMLVAGLAAFALRLVFPTDVSYNSFTIGYFALYFFMYAAGVAAKHCGWLDELNLRRAWIWAAIVVFVGLSSVIAVALKFPDAQFSGGMNPFALFYAMWEPLMCVGICYISLAVGKRWFNRPMPWIESLSRRTFAFYALHPFAVVGFTYLSEYFGIGGAWGVAFVCAVGVPAEFLVLRCVDVLRKAISGNTIVG